MPNTILGIKDTKATKTWSLTVRIDSPVPLENGKTERKYTIIMVLQSKGDGNWSSPRKKAMKYHEWLYKTKKQRIAPRFSNYVWVICRTFIQFLPCPSMLMDAGEAVWHQMDKVFLLIEIIFVWTNKNNTQICFWKTR